MFSDHYGRFGSNYAETNTRDDTLITQALSWTMASSRIVCSSVNTEVAKRRVLRSEQPWASELEAIFTG